MIVSNGFLFLQEIHPTVNDGQYIKWKDDFKDGVSHDKSNSCVVLVCFIHSKKLLIRNKLSDGPIRRTYFFSHGKMNSCGVAIGYTGSNKVDVLDKKIDKNGSILILDVKVDGSNFVLVNIYNPNTETEQVATLHDLDKMLETIKDSYDKHKVLAGDFNFFFDTSLESYGGKATLKRNLLQNLLN